MSCVRTRSTVPSLAGSFSRHSAPHATAYYPRDFAWFYPDVLVPRPSWISTTRSAGFACWKRASGLMLGPFAPMLLRPPSFRQAAATGYIGINYFSLPSDTLLGILAGLEQLMRADQRPSPYPAMSQGAQAGRLLLAEYREDLKQRDISTSRGALVPLEDGGVTALCYVTSPHRAPRPPMPAPNAGGLSQCMCLRDFCAWDRARRDGRTNRAGSFARTGTLAIQEGAAPVVRPARLHQALPCIAGEPPPSAIALDFVNVLPRILGSCATRPSARCLAATTDWILAEPRFQSRYVALPGIGGQPAKQDDPQDCSARLSGALVMADVQRLIRRPHAGVRRALRHRQTIRPCARAILGDIRTASETHGGYQELLSEVGQKYRTWAYQERRRSLWFPRFLSVWRRAFGAPLPNRELGRLTSVEICAAANAAAVLSPTSRTSGSAWR